MAFLSDNFDSPTGQNLEARPNWTLVVGPAMFKIRSDGTLGKPDTGSGGPTSYYSFGPETLPIQEFTVNSLLQAGSHAPLLLSKVLGSSASGYHLQRASGRINVVRAPEDGTAGVTLGTGPSIGATGKIRAQAEVLSDKTVIRIWIDDAASPNYTFEDTDSFSSGKRLKTGKLGLISYGVAQNGNPLYDNWTTNIVEQAITITKPAVPFYEGVRTGSGTIPVVGTYTSVTSIEGRLVDATTLNPISGFDWSTKVASPTGGAYSFNFTGVPVGTYRVQVRDSAVPGTVITGDVDRQVGAIIVVWGQSQCNILFTASGTITLTAGAKAFQLRLSDNVNATGVPQYFAMTSGFGSGVVAFANQWMADTGNIPLMLVSCNYPGTAISQWIDDAQVPQQSDTAWKLWSGIATKILNAAGNQASAVTWFQGTNDTGVANVYAGKMDTLRDKFLTLLGSSPAQPLMIINPHPRSNDPAGQMWALRDVQYQKSLTGGLWRTGAWALDVVMDGQGSPHQSGDANSNQRFGLRFGRAAAKRLVNSALDTDGPLAISFDMNDARTYIDVTFDRDIRTPGGATTNLPGWFTNTTNASPFDASVTAAITGARTVRVTKNSGTFPIGQTRIDYLRYVPFTSDPGDTTYVSAFAVTVTATADTTSGSSTINVTAISGTVAVNDAIAGAGIPSGAKITAMPSGGGPGSYTISAAATATASGVSATITRFETLLDANVFSKFITDTSSFEGGRGVVARPQMGIGQPVALPVTLRATNRTGSTATRLVQV